MCWRRERACTILFGMRNAWAFIVVIGVSTLGPTWARADEADAHYRSGLAYKQQGKLDEAVGEFEQAIKLRGDYAAAEFSLGVTHKLRNQLDKAVLHLERAAKLQPKSSDMHSSLGITYHRLGRVEDAIRELE